MSQDSMNRRTFVRRGAGAVAGLTVMSVPLLGCGSDEGGTSTGSGGSKKSIKFVAAKDPSLDPIKNDLLPQFTKETGIEVEYLESDWGTMLQKIVRDAQNNTGVYDLEIVNDVWIPQMAGPDLLHDLGELGVTISDDMFPAIAEELYWPRENEPVPPSARGKDRKLVAGCIIGDAAAFVYRTDVFDAAPATWDEVLATVQRTADPAKQQYGYVFPGSRSSGDPTTWWFPILFGYGGQILDDAWEPVLQETPGVNALEMLLALQRTAPKGVAQYGFDQITQTLNGGQVQSAIVWGGWVKDAFNPKLSRVARTIACSAPPAGTRSATLLGPFNAVIPRSAPNPEGAAKLLNWLQSRRIQHQYAERYGGISVLDSVLTDANLQDRYPYFQGMRDSLAVSQHFPPTDQFAGINDVIGIELNKAYSEQGSAGAASYLDAAASGIRDVLSRAGYYSG
jgi:multiple sugar transport system substrate-binding protein